MEQGAQPAFEAEVGIGTRWRYLDRHGSAAIADGRLTLRKRSGDVVAEAPVSEVWADTAGGSAGSAARIQIGDEIYKIAPLQVRRSNPYTLPGVAANLARDMGRLKKGRELTEVFLKVVEAEGGHRGTP